ncbi:type 1 fimbrial protein [Citrobacter amalonaticus]|uniref:type 1 fimbrial protein n=1 Tax=Citrobacter amalonaticus TaxID=35703 RepID=UPI00300C5E8C
MNIKKLFLLASLFFFSHLSLADCQRGTGLFDDKSISTSYISLPGNIVVENSDYSAGTVLYSSGWVAGSNDDLTMSGCGRSYVVGYFYLNTPQVEAPGGTQLMPTNLSGIGVRVTAMNQAGPNDSPTPVDNDWHAGSGTRDDHTLRNSQYMVELVATGGPISAGTLSFGSPLAQVDFREDPSHSAAGDIASNVVLNNTQVVIKAMGCNADTSSLRFNFDTINVTEFDTQNVIRAPEDQTVNLTCEVGTNVSLSVAAAEASGDNANHTVIALTGAGSEGVATGLGVQLGLKARTYDSGTQGLPLNQLLTIISSQRNGNLYTSGGAQAQEPLTFSASYYKTAGTVIAGTANATATLTLTYN